MATKYDFFLHGNRYVPQCAMEENAQYIYLHRSIKFKENSAKKNNVTFDGLVEGSTFEKIETLFKDSEQITQSDFDTINEAKKTKYQELKRYNPNTWKAYNVLEPLEDMKNFSVDQY